jgi:hypothetical protein
MGLESLEIRKCCFVLSRQGIFGLDGSEYSQLWNLNEDGAWHDFDSLYYHFHQEFVNLPSTPVMISEFGTLQEDGNQNEWITNAFIN